MSTPIEKAAIAVAYYFEELPKPRDIEEATAIIRRTLKSRDNHEWERDEIRKRDVCIRCGERRYDTCAAKDA